MPRQARAVAESGFYHLVLKGNGSWSLFEDRTDREVFLDKLAKSFERNPVQLIAWCLMSNHVHLIVCERDGILPKAMHSFMTAYARYLNDRQDKSGHVFDDRFWSGVIEDDAHLLEAVRYVHNNPQNAGICEAQDYYWSSYGEYCGMPGAIHAADTALILDMVGGPDRFREFCAARVVTTYTPYRGHRIPEDEVQAIATAVLAGRNPRSVGEGGGASRSADIRLLKDVGLSKAQIERCTGLGRWTIMKALGGE